MKMKLLLIVSAIFLTQPLLTHAKDNPFIDLSGGYAKPGERVRIDLSCLQTGVQYKVVCRNVSSKGISNKSSTKVVLSASSSGISFTINDKPVSPVTGEGAILTSHDNEMQAIDVKNTKYIEVHNLDNANKVYVDGCFAAG